MTTRRDALTLMAGLPLLAPLSSAKAATPPPSLEDLLRDPMALHARMSPSGKRIAVLFQQGEKKERVAFLHIIDADVPDGPRKQLVLGDYLVDGLYWANDDRLLVSFITEREEDYTPTGSRIGVKYDNSFRRLMSIRADGTAPVLMFGDQKAFQRANWDLGRLIDTLPGDPDHILMAAFEPSEIGRSLKSMSLQKLDVNTGEAELVERGLTNTRGWAVQNGVPVLRYDVSDGRRVVHVMGRAPGETEYTLVRRISVRSEWERPNFDLVSATETPGVFLAITRADGEEAAAVHTYDVRSRELGEVVAARSGRDMEDALTDDLGRFVAAGYTEDRAAYTFADPKLAPHYRAMDAFFAKKFSVKLYQTNRDHNRFLARVTGPGVHSAFYFYDSAATQFHLLGLGKPWLDANSLAQIEELDVKTRDGVMLRVYLTVPNADGPRPLIVMPHGGPETRDAVAFDSMAQAFAARGWMVLQPNFRGSGGYGQAFAEAGHGHWGDRMQEDVEDALAQVMATHAVDPARVAICGASYGGYAALMGAVRRPELYKAAVSIAGVADLPRFLSDSKRYDDSDEELIYNLWVARMGSPETEMEKLREASPAMRAADIQAPILLIHGLDDPVVPPRQSAIMAAALKQERKTYEHVEVQDAGHGGWDRDQLALIYGKAINFIAKAFA